MGLLVLWHPGVSCYSSVPSFSCFAGLCCCPFNIPSPFGPWFFLLWQMIFLYPLGSSTSLHQPHSLPSIKAYFGIQLDNRMPLFPWPLIVFNQKWIVLNLNTSPSVNGFPSLILTASLCCCKVQQSFWWTQHVISEPWCTSALHTHTQSIPGCLLWTFGAYPDLMEWFCSVCWSLRLPEARNGRRNVHVGLVFRESIERKGLGSLLELWKSSWEMWEGRIWNNRS